MIKKNRIRWFLIIYVCLTGFTGIYANPAGQKSPGSGTKRYPVDEHNQLKVDDPSADIEKLNISLLSFISAGDTAGARKCLNSLLKNIRINSVDSLILSDSHYSIGIFYLSSGKYYEAIKWLKLSSLIRKNLDRYDEVYSKCIYNLGVAYNYLGDYNSMELYALKSLEIEKKIYGESSPYLLRSFSSLVAACLNLKEYEKAISFGNTALQLIKGQQEDFKSDIADLYTNIGVCHTRLSDYSKAALYLEKAESIYLKGSLIKDERYINIINGLAVTYRFLGLKDKSDEYYDMGIEMAESNNSVLSYNFINSFAIVLGNAGKAGKGEILLSNSLKKAKSLYGSESGDYIEVLKNYAEYLRTFKIDIKKSLFLYEQCIDYINRHKEDLSLKEPVLLGYALSLAENGDSRKALENVQKLLYPGITEKTDYPVTGNPEIGQIESDQWSLNVLKAKYRILWDIYKKAGDYNFLLAAANTSELIISILEKVRINISEEESRIVLGDRYRESYLFAIRDFDQCYKKTGNPVFLEKAFEYSEKSKVAGLLASTRELKATQFHIPPDIAELEKSLQGVISFYNARIELENNKISPDISLVSEWKGNLLSATQRRDSLVDLFEKQYPEYYLIKYNTKVVKPDDIPAIIGRNMNYLNYVVTDTVLYIFVTNRKQQQIITVPIDSNFYNNIRDFRILLSMPSPLNNARTEFMQYQKLGNYLYKILFEPARQFLISNRVLISPDNILSYIPFETILSMPGSGEEIQYKDLSYLMNDFRISYTYSVTFMAESLRKDYSLTNSVIAFAPVYIGAINIDSLLLSRQVKMFQVHDLPYARQEAEYVSDITGGKLYINNGAKESVFKAESGKYDIIHLAMHTILNDQYPMHSKMIFYLDKDTIEDGLLNTYEVYGLVLKAKMVVLSSCNTGMGLLNSGEGILSLARGFIYAGSQSAIMSMWEIEDRSGTEIIKSFYHFLKNGNTKSNSLRKARINYLKTADQLRSHPYFWSTLVVYGNNAPLYYSKQLFLIIGTIILLVSVFLIFFYHRLR